MAITPGTVNAGDSITLAVAATDTGGGVASFQATMQGTSGPVVSCSAAAPSYRPRQPRGRGDPAMCSRSRSDRGAGGKSKGGTTRAEWGEGAPGRWFVQGPARALLFAQRSKGGATVHLAGPRAREAGQSAEKGQAAQRARLEWLRAGGTGEARRAWTAAMEAFSSRASAGVSSISTDESV